MSPPRRINRLASEPPRSNSSSRLPKGLPTTISVTPCSCAVASNALATSSPVVITTSAPNCRASERFLVSRRFSSSFNAADVST
jgi:hypothetical protein